MRIPKCINQNIPQKLWDRCCGELHYQFYELGFKWPYVGYALDYLFEQEFVLEDLHYILDFPGPLGSGYFSEFTLSPSVLIKLKPQLFGRT